MNFLDLFFAKVYEFDYDRCCVICYILVLVADVIAKDVMAYCQVTDVMVTLVLVADVNHLIFEVIDCIVTDGITVMADVIAICI